MSTGQPTHHPAFQPAHRVGAAATPWMPSTTPGKRSRPLRFLAANAGFVEEMELQPGVATTLHRHTGAVHAWNLEGSRRLCTGEVVGPGEYVYEPAGNTDWWVAIGDVPLRILVVVHGTVEYLDAQGKVLRRVDAASLRIAYQQWCAEHGIDALDLG